MKCEQGLVHEGFSTKSTIVAFGALKIKVSDIQANAKLAQKEEHQTRMAEVPTSIFPGGNILLLELFI